MALSLYTVVIPSFQQILGSVARLIDTAEQHCADNGLSSASIIDARLIDDMLPFAYQVKSTVVHSAGAIDGVKAGYFQPDQSTPPDSFAGLRERVAMGLEKLDALDPEEVDALEGGAMRFGVGDRHIDFTAENFLLSFSFPNFYFHATTAYDILRMKGVSIGKRDYMGRFRKLG